MTARIVVDLGFGDAGKGLTVDYLAQEAVDTNLVVRFSGGHQVGHTVVRDGRRHTFSNFGAATMLGVPTYYLPETTLFPPAAVVEAGYLNPVRPELLVHPLAMVTTPFDVAYNRATERVNGHGSCGVGFGATVERHGLGIVFYAKDLVSPWMIRQRLRSVDAYYRSKAAASGVGSAYEREASAVDAAAFVDACTEYLEMVTFARVDELPVGRPNLILEGSQGIMLDQVHGVFPHVTRAYTTSKTALDTIRSQSLTDAVDTYIDIYYVTRCYQTRHGNGPMSSSAPVILENADDEANVENEFQGAFRTAELDPELLNYALASDAVYHEGVEVRKHLMITCLDQRPGFDVSGLLGQLDTEFASVTTSYGPCAVDCKPF